MEKDDSLYQGKYRVNSTKEKVIMSNLENKSSCNLKRGAILVAEDNKQNQRVLQILVSQKYPLVEIFFVANGKELLEEMGQDEYDLILLDMSMPVMNGFQAIGHIRESGSVIPVVALTASSLGDDKEKCINAGCDGYIPKPIDVNELYAVIDRYVFC